MRTLGTATLEAADLLLGLAILTAPSLVAVLILAVRGYHLRLKVWRPGHEDERDSGSD